METTNTFTTAPVMSAPSPNITTVAPISYAGFWKRFAAYIIDGILVSIVTWVVIAIGFASSITSMIATVRVNPQDPAHNAVVVGQFLMLYLSIVGIIVAAGWLYYALMESSAKQATIGKMALGVIVTDLDGKRISFARATGRYFGKLISGMILGVGYMMAGFTDKKQALHDMIAGTLVINKQ